MMISIIIPVYNEQENLTKRLSFLSEQANKFSVEIIIANSPETTDESKKICKKYKNIIYLDCIKKGRAAQMNAGAAIAKGDILMFLHADVILPEDFYHQVTTSIKNGNRAGFFAYNFDRKTFLLDINSKFTVKDGLFAGGGDQCQFFTKEVFNSFNGYNEDFCIMEDFEMMDRIRKEKISFKIIQSKATVSARKYDDNSWLKVNLINGYVFLKYRLGYSPIKLRKTYKSLLRENV